jgi:anaerobic magnesium-protoporphyrin IX monomethyl ester cyclase
MPKLCLIRPAILELRYQATTLTCPPIGLAYLAAAARAAGHGVTVIDAVGEAPTNSSPLEDDRLSVRGLTADEIVARIPADTDVLGVSCMFSQDWPYVKRVLRALRARFPRALIVAGGEHVTALPEVVLEEVVDYCVVGEGEETLVELLDAIRDRRPLAEVPGLVTRDANAAVTRTEPRARVADVDSLPLPAWDLFPLEAYLGAGYGFGVDRGRGMPILATRGCPYRCTFCSSPTMWTTRWSARDPAKVLDEIRGYIERYGATNFDFYDLTAIIKREWIIAFCRLVKASGLEFTWQLPTGTRSEAIDEEVSRLLFATGCRNITYAPESGSPSELQRIKKKVKLDAMKRSMRAATRQGIYVKSNIVFGFPGQTRRELWESMRFIVDMAALGVRDTMVYLFCPYPGSEMYRELRAAGRIGPPNDEYFKALTCYADLSQGLTWTDHLTGRQLAWARLGGQLLFYVVSYLVRPWRSVQTAYHVAIRRHESPMERALGGFARRLVGGALGRTGRRSLTHRDAA